MSIVSLSLQAQSDGQYEITPRLNIVGSSGKPTNDVLGVGVTIHRKIFDDWYLGVNIDHSPSFDFERTPDVAGVIQDPSIKTLDAIGTMTMLTAVAEKRYALESENWTGFWNLGVGINDVNMENVTGPVSGGGTFNIVTDIDTEFIILGNVGFVQKLGETWSARYEFGVEHHSGDWKVRDTVSGMTGTIGEYTIYGIRLGMTYQY